MKPNCLTNPPPSPKQYHVSFFSELPPLMPQPCLLSWMKRTKVIYEESSVEVSCLATMWRLRLEIKRARVIILRTQTQTFVVAGHVVEMKRKGKLFDE